MTGRAYVSLNWERDGQGNLSAYLSIARPGQAAERIPLTLPCVARIIADGAMLWSVVEPMRQGSMQNLHNAAEPDHLPKAGKMVVSDHIEDHLAMVSSDESEGRPRYNPAVDDDTQVAPHFIGTWGE